MKPDFHLLLLAAAFFILFSTPAWADVISAGGLLAFGRFLNSFVVSDQVEYQFFAALFFRN